MVPFNSILRSALAVVLLLAQSAGGLPRVVHCYDPSCESVGLDWECHAMCDGVHSHEHASDCGHDRSEQGTVLCAEIAAGGSILESTPCGSDHHHHYLSPVELGLIAFSAESATQASQPIALHAFRWKRVDSLRVHLSFQSVDAECRLAVPLVTRLRI